MEIGFQDCERVRGPTNPQKARDQHLLVIGFWQQDRGILLFLGVRAAGRLQ